eukprot:scaffold717_cov402-Pavlova_lutheri.AAC.3
MPRMAITKQHRLLSVRRVRLLGFDGGAINNNNNNNTSAKSPMPIRTGWTLAVLRGHDQDGEDTDLRSGGVERRRNAIRKDVPGGA